MNKTSLVKDILLVALLILFIIGYYPQIRDKFVQKNDISHISESTHINSVVNQEIPTLNNQVFHDENLLMFAYRTYVEECNGVCFRIKIYKDGFCSLYTNETPEEISINLTQNEIKFLNDEMIANDIFGNTYEDRKFCPETNGGYRVFFSNGENARTISNMNCGQKHVPDSVDKMVRDLFAFQNLTIIEN